MDNREKLKQAECFARDNLEECCRELIEWHDTAILRNGKVRELSEMLSFATWTTPGAHRMAESLISRAALEHICNID